VCSPVEARLTFVNPTRYPEPVERPVDRRDQILDVAARLFAERGFHGVSVGDIGKAVGVSGPALYKHFDSKDAVLAEMLVAISERLLGEGEARVAAAADAEAALGALVDWHVEFALAQPSLIVVQDRDWQSLPEEARERVRALQREYVDLWATQLLRQHPGIDLDRGRAMAHATFGLINSTPHSSLLPPADMHELLSSMALRSLS
jgi:AcrR family transcriptional regulator